MTGDLPVTGVTVDLDDTLYPQSEWLEGAWSAVAVAAGRAGLDPSAVHAALLRTCAEGSDRGGVVDRALAAVGLADERAAELVPGLVRAFAAHRPAVLTPYPGVLEALGRLAAVLPVVVVTDGMPPVQHAKVEALGVRHLLAAVVVSDELGGRHLRKPDPAPFRRALEVLGQPPAGVVHVGDRPEKDVRGAAAVGMRSIRVATGEYAGADPGRHRAWRTVPCFAEAVELCLAGAPAAPGPCRPAGTTGAASRL
ncbi:MAG: HAD family hydrolase [Sporichthyaceae bacterium]